VGVAREYVLIVDANQHDRCFLASVLQEADFAVGEADNTVLALARMRSRRPTVIVLDLHLPEGESYDLLVRLRKDPALQAIPVFGISSPLSPNEEQKALQYGCAGYFQKPVNAAELMARLIDPGTRPGP